MSFEYPYTCPVIDGGLTGVKSDLKHFFESFLEEACPLLPSGCNYSIALDKAEEVMAIIEPFFEKVRSTNTDMRDAADDQISDLESEVESLESEIEDLKAEIDELRK